MLAGIQVVRAKTEHGEGVDVILDMVAGEYVQKNLDLLKPGGRIAIIGSLGGGTS